MDNQEEVVVVSISDYSWNILKKEKFYAFPMGSRKDGKYFAFYRKGEISHYAEVKEIVEGGKEDIGYGYWLYCMPDAEPPFKIVKFKRIIKLKNPITREESKRGGHVQGKVYTTLKRFLRAKTISDLKKK
ncbi:MAG: hypothetical protein KKE23_02525 [Nanoarchaeota archaeon]|nr:hypothetical protein [Nanoarchaeota archaeon]